MKKVVYDCLANLGIAFLGVIVFSFFNGNMGDYFLDLSNYRVVAIVSITTFFILHSMYYCKGREERKKNRHTTHSKEPSEWHSGGSS